MRWVKWLCAILALELVVCTALIVQRRNRFVAPAPNLAKLDPASVRAIEQLRQDTKGGDSRNWRELAEAFLGNGYYVAAEQCFQQAAALTPKDNAQLIYSQAFCLERVGRTQEAIEKFRQALAASGSELATTCWYQIGRCFLRQQDAAQAEAAFLRISDFPPAAFQLTKLMIRSGRSEDAQTILDSQLAVMPNSLKLLQLKRQAALASADFETAEFLRDLEERADYQLELEYSQRFITMFASRFGLPALLSRAMDLKSAGTLQQRKATLDQALSVIRKNELWQYRSVFLAAAHVELGLGNFSAVEQLISEIRTYSQDGVDLLELDGLLLAARGKISQAVEVWQRARSIAPSQEIINDLLESGALTQSEQASCAAQAELLAGMNAYRNNRLEEARTALLKATKGDPEDSRGWFYLAETERLSGAIDNAVAAYSKCIEIWPQHGRAYAALQEIPEASGGSGE